MNGEYPRRPCTFALGLPTTTQLLPAPKMAPKESKTLAAGHVKTSLLPTISHNSNTEVVPAMLAYGVHGRLVLAHLYNTSRLATNFTWWHRVSVSAPSTFFFNIPHPCLFLPPLTKEFATKKARVM